jgi:nucleoredoxin
MLVRCAPCRQFTPVLAKFYNEMKKQNKKLEIIWVSRDQTSEDFLQYFAKMPWLAVTMQNIQEVYNRLAPLYQEKGIPHLVFIDAQSGDVITLDGRTKVLQDPYGLQFPWRSRSVANLLPSSLKESLIAQVRALQAKLKGQLLGFLSGFLPNNLVKHFMTR